MAIHNHSQTREQRTVKIITIGGVTIQPVFVYGPTWEYRANFQARKMCPPIIMCKYCLNPVITGFKCEYCGEEGNNG